MPHSAGANAFQRRVAKFSSVTRRGQATIPVDIRRSAGIAPGDKVRFALVDGRITLEKQRDVDQVWNKAQSAMMCEWEDSVEDAYNE